MRAQGFLPLLGSVVLWGCSAAKPACSVVANADQANDEFFIERSHEVLAAYDHGDNRALGAVLANNFLHVDGSSTTTRAEDLASSPGIIGKRTWSQERVSSSPNVRIFRGLAEEEQVGNEVHGNYRFRSVYTLVWTHESEAWRLALLTSQVPGYEDENVWNSIYENRLGFSQEPNKLLVAAVSGISPGHALDVATGQGRNGLYLASQGWKVTGVDFSMEGLRQAREVASARHVDFDPVYANLDDYDFGVDKWNLVTMIYAPNLNWIDRIKPRAHFING